MNISFVLFPETDTRRTTRLAITHDELFFADRVVLKVYGGIPALLSGELAEISYPGAAG